LLEFPFEINDSYANYLAIQPFNKLHSHMQGQKGIQARGEGGKEQTMVPERSEAVAEGLKEGGTKTVERKK